MDRLKLFKWESLGLRKVCFLAYLAHKSGQKYDILKDQREDLHLLGRRVSIMSHIHTCKQPRPDRGKGHRSTPETHTGLKFSLATG